MTLSGTTQDELKKNLQSFFTDGLVTIVGSGLSCAEGLPGMGRLSEALSDNVPTRCDPADLSLWEKINDALKSGTGLEEAINLYPPTEKLERAIIEVVAAEIKIAEAKAVNACIKDGRKLKFSYVLPHLSPKSPKWAKVITTNYDRLIEVAAELDNYWVDTGFCGKVAGSFNPQQSQHQGAIEARMSNKSTPNLRYPDRVYLCKPDGSLDWVLRGDHPIYTHFPISETPLIITPGVSKYLRCHYPPFDTHISLGNKMINDAAAFLFIGYGFNDNHLQTHLTLKIKAQTKSLILARTLTPSTKEIIRTSPSAIALSDDGSGGTQVTTSTDSWVIDGQSWWDIENFVKEVL